MTQIWPGFGEGPVPTLVSMICNPEAVVMGFPGALANASASAMTMAASAIATAETNEAAKRRKRIRSPSLFNAGGCLAQHDWRCYPVRPRYSPAARAACEYAGRWN